MRGMERTNLGISWQTASIFIGYWLKKMDNLWNIGLPRETRPLPRATARCTYRVKRTDQQSSTTIIVRSFLYGKYQAFVKFRDLAVVDIRKFIQAGVLAKKKGSQFPIW